MVAANLTLEQGAEFPFWTFIDKKINVSMPLCKISVICLGQIVGKSENRANFLKQTSKK